MLDFQPSPLEADSPSVATHTLTMIGSLGLNSRGRIQKIYPACFQRFWQQTPSLEAKPPDQ